jgi:AraC-like DNA-binding protein
VEWNLPNQHFYSTKDCIYFAYPGKLESWISREGIKGYLLCFTEEFMQERQSPALGYPFFSFEHSNLLELDNLEAKRLAQQQEEILNEINGNLPDSSEMISVLLHRYLIDLRRLYARHVEAIPEKERNEIQILQRFRQQLDHYFAELAAGKAEAQPTVSVLADRLFLHPSYLNAVIKTVSGKTASSFIYEKTILEAKSYLIHTPLQVAEIAARLGFSSVSYFNRFFKKWTTLSPTAFKKAQE